MTNRNDRYNKSNNSLCGWSDVVSTVIHESSRTALERALRFILEHMTHAMQRMQSKTLITFSLRNQSEEW